MAVLTSLSRYTDRGLPFEAFVYRIAANQVADAQRGTLRGAVPTDDVPDQVDSAAGPEEHALRSDQARAVWELMDRLSPSTARSSRCAWPWASRPTRPPRRWA
ncbi:hypothetical protein GCM10025872_28010 [Barrientosiimonas endolithica]|uniref:RNA polymerase sigma-70 region 2 domain-containing protein n=1 Tax=Barrientosiimonas endolithica TaxID=1535208 RepID=A0ABN6YNX5_9MICO|nr:hypothetical protein GCM10025872_28010 [Barrientosiimonas endolithica]